MYSVQSAHMARFLHPSDACIHPTPALRYVSEVAYDPTPLIVEVSSAMCARRLPVTPGSRDTQLDNSCSYHLHRDVVTTAQLRRP